MNDSDSVKKYKKTIKELRLQLSEANDTLEAIRTGQVDALVVQQGESHKLYTLQTADHSYRVFIQNMNEGALTLNKAGVVVYSNATFAGIINKPLSKVMGMTFSDFLWDDEKNELNNKILNCWSHNCKFEAVLKSGTTPVPVLLSLKTLEIEEQTTMSMIVTNLTTLKKAQQLLEIKNTDLATANHALEVSNQDLQQFASVASHDLQEPLRKIYMFSDLLINKEFKVISPESKQYLEKIVSSAARMKALVVDMLDYSKLSSQNAQPIKVKLNEVVNEVEEDLELVIAEKKAVLEVQNLPSIYCNRGQLRQVFQNIIYNALKFSKVNVLPKITISGVLVNELRWNSIEDKKGKFCIISIADNGIGFDDKYAENIFNLFERLNSKDAYEGTGIGLSITKKIIEKHGGLIKAESKKNKGATFHILLPLQYKQNN